MTAAAHTVPVPPQDIDAEEYVLGAMFLAQHAVDACHEILHDGRDFYRESHAVIYRACLELAEAGEPVDAILVADRLHTQGTLDRVGGRDRIQELAGLVPAAGNAAHYARIVADHARLRDLINTGHDIARLGWERPGPIDGLIDRAQQAAFELGDNNTHGGASLIGPAVRDVFERMGELAASGATIIGTPTGIPTLDRYTAGLQSGQLVVVAARPGMGKSALALTITRNITLRGPRRPVALFSMEMSRAEITQRLLAAESHISLEKFRSPGLGINSDGWAKIADAANRVSEAPLYVDDRRGRTLAGIRTEIRRLKAREPELALVVVDYLQLMEAEAENRTQEVTKISRGLKAVAGDFDVPVLALSQLNRAVEGRTQKRPQLSDLRESGSVEQDADVVAFIYREGYYNKRCDTPNVAELELAKQRNGALGTVELVWNGPLASFTETA